MKSIYIIAEIGPNHLGSLKLAKEYVRILSKTGVNAVKFQIGNPYEHYSKDAFFPKYQIKNISNKEKYNIYEIVKKRILSFNDHLVLERECKKYKIDYLCSAFDTKSLKFLLKKFKLNYIKVPSGEILTLDYLKVLSYCKIPIILSTGMATEDEIFFSIKKINENFKKKIILLHCVSSYPTDIKNLNLNYMLKLSSKFGYPVGFSDHTNDALPSIVAASLGAKVIEKHVTLNNFLSGPDHQASLNIDHVQKFVKNIRDVDKIKGKSIKILSFNEKEVKKSLRKSCVAKKFIKKGQILKSTDIVFKRPGTGISPMNLEKILDRRVNQNIFKDRLIYFKYLK
jgi:N,N'-diacetyllegionaminate synthase